MGYPIHVGGIERGGFLFDFNAAGSGVWAIRQTLTTGL
jgi:hypothetical protein